MFHRQHRKIVWVRPSSAAVVPERPRRESITRSVLHRIDLDIDLDREAVPIDEPVLEILEPQAGTDLELPSLPDASPEEELRELLRAAAEIEHGLMAQYLYAAHSCSIRSMADIVRQISVEEMGHLVTVQNLLLAAGERPYLGRYDRSPNEFDPFAFHLEPISREVIAKYAVCEIPDESAIDPEEQEVLEALTEDATASAGGMTPHRVGLLYMKIYWLLRPMDEAWPTPAEEPWPGYPVERVAEMFPGFHVAEYPRGGAAFPQAGEDDWQAGNRSVIVETIATRGHALRAVARITAQGEGFAEEPDAHFDRFVEIYRKAASETEPIALSFATDPWYRRESMSVGAPEAEITSALAVDLSRLGDFLYEILLNVIALSLHPESGLDPAGRSAAATFSILLMREMIKPLARHLPRLRIRDDPESPQLSLCLTLPEGTDDPAGIRERLASRIDEAIGLSKALEETAGLDTRLRSAAGDIRELLEAQREAGTIG